MELDELYERLREGSRDTKAYLVGGCVRDGLMGRPFVDLDLAVTQPEAFARRLASALRGTLVPLGERFGAWRVVVGERIIDVAAMQGDIVADLGRRDFTVNAMAVPLRGEKAALLGNPVQHSLTVVARSDLIDPFGGVEDLRRAIVRMVSPDNLSADPVRLLRGVRLAAELGLSVDPDTEGAIAARAGLLGQAALERQREEFCRILAAEGAAGSLGLLDRLGLLQVLLPELDQGKGVGQPREHYWDVFDHEIETVAAVEAVLDGHVSRPYLNVAAEMRPFRPGLQAPPEGTQAATPGETLEGYFHRPVGNLTRRTLLKLAALLHDVGKPATKSVQPNGRVRFFGHSELGAEMAKTAMARLRFSEQQIKVVTTMVRHHLRPAQWSDGGVPTPRALYRYFRDLGDVAVDTIFLNLADYMAARGPLMDPLHWGAHVAVTSYAMASSVHQEKKAPTPRLVTGNDVMEAFGLEPGPVVGQLLTQIDDAWRLGRIGTREEALDLARRALRHGPQTLLRHA